MKIFITGINGVLGSTLKTELRRRGHDVYGCDLTHSNDPQVIRADIAERRQLTRAMSQFGWPPDFDLLYHFAAEFGRKNGQDFYEDLWRTNCVGTRNVIEECITTNTPMAFASSSEAYGLSEKYSIGALTEEMLDIYPPQFHNEYALTKYTNERQIFMAVRNAGLKAVVFRFFNIYGPPERYSVYRSVACQFAYQLLNGLPITVNKGGKRAHLWIGDWAQTVANLTDVGKLSALLSSKRQWRGSAGITSTPVFNVGGQEYGSNEDLYHATIDALQKERIVYPAPIVTFTDGEEANTAAKEPNSSVAETWLNHSPKTKLVDGLRDTVRWMVKEYGL